MTRTVRNRPKRDYTASCTREDAERAIDRAILAFQHRGPSDDRVDDLMDAIEALLRANYDVARVLAVGAAHRRSGARSRHEREGPPRSLEDTKRAYAAARAELDRRNADVSE